MKTKPVAVKKTAWGKIRPKISTDTLNGKEINNGLISMGYHLATYTTKAKGKTVRFDLIGGGGCTISVSGGRDFVVDIAALFDHAVENGLLDEKINFTETDQD